MRFQLTLLCMVLCLHAATAQLWTWGSWFRTQGTPICNIINHTSDRSVAYECQEGFECGDQSLDFAVFGIQFSVYFCEPVEVDVSGTTEAVTEDGVLQTTGATTQDIFETTETTTGNILETTEGTTEEVLETTDATTQNILETTETALETTETALETTETALETTETALETTQTALETTETALETTETALETTETALETTETALETTQTALETTETALETTQTALETTEPALETAEPTTSVDLETTAAVAEPTTEAPVIVTYKIFISFWIRVGCRVVNGTTGEERSKSCGRGLQCSVQSVRLAVEGHFLTANCCHTGQQTIDWPRMLFGPRGGYSGGRGLRGPNVGPRGGRRGIRGGRVGGRRPYRG